MIQSIIVLITDNVNTQCSYLSHILYYLPLKSGDIVDVLPSDGYFQETGFMVVAKYPYDTPGLYLIGGVQGLTG